MSNSDLNNVDSRLRVLHHEVAETLAASERKTRWASLILILLLIVIGAYWGYLYQQVSLVNADTVAQIAYQRTLDSVRSSQPQISQALRERAPEIFDYAESQVLQAPAALSSYVRATALEKTQTVLDNAEPTITKVIDDALAQSHQAMIIAGADPKDPAQITRMIDSVANQIDSQIKADFDKVYAEYDARANEFVSYLNQMADGKNLDPRQQHLRNVIVSFLAVAEKRKTVTD